jgi:serine/threonine-protein kinase
MPAKLEAGAEVADRYRVDEEIGRGGMGAVYVADDLALPRKVALKVLQPEALSDATARARFQEEIDSCVRIEHPHVVPVHDAGFDGSHFYIAMRLIDGPDLSRIISDFAPLNETRALRLLGQIANALDAVHRERLIHRDVKPANVLIWNSGADDEHCYLTDFGIAKALDDTGTLSTAGPIGTPAYMAPEVCAGRVADAQADQYSLACLAYEMLSGRLPLEGEGAALLEAHMSEEPRSLSTDAPHVSPQVRAAIQQGLAKSPADRYPSVKELANAASGASKESFEQSEAVSEALSRAKTDKEVVTSLTAVGGLSDARIAEVARLKRSRDARQRLRAARKALTGELGPRSGS